MQKAMSSELTCYNRGCGQKYDPKTNSKEACRHHPGLPFFHDAYKGWQCCNKKCTDFTEFLNIKGCTLSEHSNVKPPEPEKPVAKEVPDVEEVVQVKPLVASSMVRPPFDTPMTTLKPEIAPSLKNLLESTNLVAETKSNPNEIAIGTSCQNGGCRISYDGPETNHTDCVHHPGTPIFHEGLKYWSCCQKKTTDFNAFLGQIGCETGKHVWIKEKRDNTVQCRWDHHQTGTHVIVSIYAKQYCPKESAVKLNPIRLYANLVFPQENNACFNIDLELKGIVDVKASQVSMFGTKVEIKMRKAEPGSWARLDIPKMINSPVKKEATTVENITPQIECVDLSDL